ncbi:MAG: hypothetical protein EKK63_12255 [Acinetobacter sp.]|uniref:hypothetical protein n=1 Tax=Acinetobacter sp. TaxID=472 RepID=UPI000FC2AA33|nr:hypothetical protein [Acinetobacter sp.]RUP38436.1 MAG: hypothetical protein EKK63_12255 [Acinetobacter sp.]
MAKLSKAQQYLLGFLQRGEYKLYVNRPARVGVLRPVSGVLSNPIYITLAQADGLINRDAVLEEDATIYIDNPAFERVPKVIKSVRNSGGYVSYYVEKKIPQKTEDNS